MSHLTVAGGVLGTADFMAPEQAESEPVSVRTDLYSLGSVLFTLLAGRPPFVARSAPEVMRKLTSEPAPPVRRFAPHTPREFEQIIAQLLEKDPQRRIATALATGNRLKAMAFALTHETRIEGSADEEMIQEERPPKARDANDGLSSGMTRSPDSVVQNVDFVEGSLERHKSSTVVASDDELPAQNRQETTGTFRKRDPAKHTFHHF